MSSIPLATPYPWPDEDDFAPSTRVEEEGFSASSGSGFGYLQSQLLSSSEMSGRAKRILVDLLDEENVKLKGSPPKIKKRKQKKKLVTTVLDSSMSELTILDLAAAGEISLLGSLLSVIEDANGVAVASKTLLQTCALAVNPAKTPGLLDAREMIMAALHLLSQEYYHDSSSYSVEDDSDSPDDFPVLPLIRPLSITGDLERRSYEKCYDWMLADILPQVAALEEGFYNAGNDYKWLPREKFLPAIKDADTQRQLLLRGRIVHGEMGNMKLTMKHQAQHSTSTSKKSKTQHLPSSHASEFVSNDDDAVAAEASRIMSETNTYDSP